MTGWTNEPAHAIAAAVRSGAASALEVTETYLSKIEALNPRLGAYTDVTAARARASARAVDDARRAGIALPPLAGVPFAVKNLFDVKGLTTRAGSKINRDNPAAEADSPLISRLEEAGAVLLGALNMGEYAYDFTGQNLHDGPSRNPHDTQRLSGGSSGGSGVAAAAGLAALTLGSDTNGSIRVPASLCGLFGLKPTFGALSRANSYPFVASFDHLGPLARSARDLALAFDAMSGPDAADPACLSTGKAHATAALDGAKAYKIAIADGHFARNGEPDAFDAVAKIAKALGATDHVTLPEAARARAAAYIITMIEAASLHGARIRERYDDFDPEVRDRLVAGAMLPGAWYVSAQKFRRWYRDEVLKLFGGLDAILAPATPCVAPLASEKTFVLDGVTLPVRANLGVYTQPISFIGLPVVAVPTWTARGLPIGVQIIAAPGREDVALTIAHRLERDGICAAPVAKL